MIDHDELLRLISPYRPEYEILGDILAELADHLEEKAGESRFLPGKLSDGLMAAAAELRDLR